MFTLVLSLSRLSITMPPYSRALGASPRLFSVSRIGPMTTLFRVGSKLKKINRFKSPVWLEGGDPGADDALRFRILPLAVRLTNAPNREKTFRVALSTAPRTLGLSKNNCFIFI